MLTLLIGSRGNTGVLCFEWNSNDEEADGHGDNPDQDGGQLEGRLAGLSGPVRNHVRFAVHFHILGGPGCVSGRSWVPLKPGPLPPLPPPVK